MSEVTLSEVALSEGVSAERVKVGVLVSGRGSNLQALLDAAADPTYPAEIALVVCNVPGAYALERAAQAGVATVVISHKEYPNRATFEAALDTALRAAGVEIVALAGFMRILGDAFIAGWQDRLLNIHPSLLPAFKGLHTHEQALAAGVREHGCTVHLVRPTLDSGPILAQATVPVLAGDDAETLAARVLVQEHRLYPQVLRWLAEGRVVVDGEMARIVGEVE